MACYHPFLGWGKGSMTFSMGFALFLQSVCALSLRSSPFGSVVTNLTLGVINEPPSDFRVEISRRPETLQEKDIYMSIVGFVASLSRLDFGGRINVKTWQDNGRPDLPKIYAVNRDGAQIKHAIWAFQLVVVQLSMDNVFTGMTIKAFNGVNQVLQCDLYRSTTPPAYHDGLLVPSVAERTRIRYEIRYVPGGMASPVGAMLSVILSAIIQMAPLKSLTRELEAKSGDVSLLVWVARLPPSLEKGWVIGGLLNMALYLYDRGRWRDIEVDIFEGNLPNSLGTITVWQGELKHLTPHLLVSNNINTTALEDGKSFTSYLGPPRDIEAGGISK